jgi:hypothetical protein
MSGFHVRRGLNGSSSFGQSDNRVDFDLDAGEEQGLHRCAGRGNRVGESGLISRIETREIRQVGKVAGAFDHIGKRAAGPFQNESDVLQRQFGFLFNRTGARVAKSSGP